MIAVRWIAAFVVALPPPGLAQGQSDYDRHVFFDNSLTPGRYFHSAGKLAEPSVLLLSRGRLPVDTLTFFTPPNALRMEWRSADGGEWSASPGGDRLDRRALASLIFVQGRPDGAAHSLVIDEIRLDGAAGAARVSQSPIAAPTGLRATGYDRHIDLVWRPPADRRVERYVIYRSLDGGDFRPLGIQRAGLHRHADFLGAQGREARYRVTASGRDDRESAPSEPAAAATRPSGSAEIRPALARIAR
jgi:hypothetical protein